MMDDEEYIDPTEIDALGEMTTDREIVAIIRMSKILKELNNNTERESVMQYLLKRDWY